GGPSASSRPPGWPPSDPGPRSAASRTACRCAPGSWLLSRLAVARWATTKWPAFRRRHRRPGFLNAGVRLLLGHRVHVVLDKIYQADAEIDSRDGYARKSADSA